MADVNVWIIVGAALLAGLTPGPVMLAIAGTAMARGRRHAFAVAYGITAGASVWALFAGLGMGAILTANQWLFETLRLLGAGYLAWLGIRAARAAIRPDRAVATRDLGGASLWVAALRGALIHLTNPKALLFWGSIFAIGIAPGAPATAVIWVIALSMGVNVAIVTAWALLFSRPAMMAAYLRFRRWIEATFAAFFGAAAAWIVANRTA